MRFKSEVARSLPSAALPKSTTERRSGPKASFADCKKELRTSAIGGGSCGRGSGVEELMQDLARHGIDAGMMLGCRGWKVNEWKANTAESVCNPFRFDKHFACDIAHGTILAGDAEVLQMRTVKDGVQCRDASNVFVLRYARFARLDTLLHRFEACREATYDCVGC